MENKKHVRASDMNAIPPYPHMYYSTFIVKATSSEEKTFFHKNIRIATF